METWTNQSISKLQKCKSLLFLSYIMRQDSLSEDLSWEWRSFRFWNCLFQHVCQWNRIWALRQTSNPKAYLQLNLSKSTIKVFTFPLSLWASVVLTSGWLCFKSSEVRASTNEINDFNKLDQSQTFKPSIRLSLFCNQLGLLILSWSSNDCVGLSANAQSEVWKDKLCSSLHSTKCEK